MNTTLTPHTSPYAAAYARGRHAAQEHVPASENPHHPRSPAFQAWNDGHYDGQSARNIEIERHSSLVWSHGGPN